MGYLKGLQVDELRLPTDPTFVVVMRRKAPYGADLAMENAMVKVTAEDLAQLAAERQRESGNGNGHAATAALASLNKVDVAASTRAMIVACIASWNLTDEQDQPLPVTPENIDKLEPIDGRFLAAEAMKRIQARRSEEERRPFDKRSSLPSTRRSASGSRRHGA